MNHDGMDVARRGGAGCCRRGAGEVHLVTPARSAFSHASLFVRTHMRLLQMLCISAACGQRGAVRTCVHGLRRLCVFLAFSISFEASFLVIEACM